MHVHIYIFVVFHVLFRLIKSTVKITLKRSKIDIRTNVSVCCARWHMKMKHDADTLCSSLINLHYQKQLETFSEQ